jgi:hypothetical protein
LDHYNAVWDPGDLSFEMVDDLTSDPVVTIVVLTPDGRLSFMAEPEMIGSRWSCTGFICRTPGPTRSAPGT